MLEDGDPVFSTPLVEETVCSQLSILASFVIDYLTLYAWVYWALFYSVDLYMSVIIKKMKNNKCWQGCREKATLMHCWWEYKLVQPLWKTVWRFLKKLKIELLYDPIIPLLEDICTLMFIAPLSTVVKIWKQSKCPLIDE